MTNELEFQDNLYLIEKDKVANEFISNFKGGPFNAATGKPVKGGVGGGSQGADIPATDYSWTKGRVSVPEGAQTISAGNAFNTEAKGAYESSREPGAWDKLSPAEQQVYRDRLAVGKMRDAGKLNDQEYSDQMTALKARLNEAREPGSNLRRAQETYESKVKEEQGYKTHYGRTYWESDYGTMYGPQGEMTGATQNEHDAAWDRLSPEEKRLQSDWYELKQAGKRGEVTREQYAQQAQALMERDREAGRRAGAVADRPTA